MNLLITGFMPFGGSQKNITKTLLDDFTYTHENIHVFKVILPTIFNIEKPLRDAIDKSSPDVIIHLGEHGKAEAITLERVAINFDDARIPDNEENQPIDLPINPYGQPAYFSRLPLRNIESALKAASIPVTLSYSAGTYVCNHLFYVSEQYLSERKNQIKSGFIHLPLTHDENERSLFDLDLLKKALSIIIDMCVLEN